MPLSTVWTWKSSSSLFFSVEAGYSIPIVLGLAGIALVTCLCAYLLIYNILYLSSGRKCPVLRTSSRPSA